MKHTYLTLTEELNRAARIRAIEKGLTLNRLIAEAVEQYLATKDESGPTNIKEQG